MRPLQWLGSVIGGRMQNPRTKLAMFVILLTVGIALNLVGINWLTCLGIALIILSGEFSSSRSKVSVSVLALLLAVLAFASWDSWNVSHNVRTPRHWRSWAVLTAIWLLGLSWECWFWRRNRSTASHDQPPNSTIP